MSVVVHILSLALSINASVVALHIRGIPASVQHCIVTVPCTLNAKDTEKTMDGL